MAEVYAGSAVLEVDGREIEITKLDVKKQTGRKLVKTMNSSGHAQGFSKGISEYSLNVSAIVPLDTQIIWEYIEDAKITVFPLGHDEKRTSYLGCFTTEVGQSYTVDGEATIDITMNALKEVKE
ncbi:MULTISPECIES: phage tail protein [Pasteurellaceae]|uniref:Phage tail protein n=1 Tax=Pasteurella atlantica TaxID=2827233 RepID=A0AAW8CPD8_9PAST|nr:phage tail protein [Pasteurella atlantica]MBR0574072.1 phage tail protein [Pasteurella atlantica]MDP8040105.1 phage tail protein [Pasteurella atlantica]MDP8042218.1 phage tail protein [Pasteurella atlantica]MDP8044375.1 phage tail protein [Pasteurella atlantica]MDP8046377.1 phage tail protein [Pasteurella atlantica]